MVTSQDDRRARFETLVRSTYVPLQRYLRRRLDPASAEDVLGDVLLVLWRRFDDVPTEAALPWCYAVARGCLANEVRGDRRRHLLRNRLRSERPPSSTTHSGYVDGPPGRDGPLDDLEQALSMLSGKHREVLHLWAWEQLAPREIAVALGITPNAASIRLHRATSRLKEIVAEGKDRRPGGHLAPREGTEAIG